MNKDLEKLINWNRTSYDSWSQMLPEGHQFVWSFIINGIHYKLNRFDPKITNSPSEFSLWEIMRGSSSLIVSGDEKIILEFFKSTIRESKLNDLNIS